MMVWGTSREGALAGICYLQTDGVVLVPLHVPVPNKDGKGHGRITSRSTICDSEPYQYLLIVAHPRFYLVW